ncbi:glutathione hydrolase 1 proenzyme-like [Aphidius gifuensis]|uniref:glutathione hydrolase 1 proenzyme-like n=1 Tax=Aphidius gifuensis TaxID=684658 RepID=UPI001CDC4676|nr:glutathione hydrolase 1 proenzyme-like [Aphidius gifuensis]
MFSKYILTTTVALVLLKYQCYSADPSVSAQFKKSAVCAGANKCAEIGSSTLNNGGSAVDAAIATMICNNLVHPHLAGYGGGFFMTIYDKANKHVDFLNAREKAPGDISKASKTGVNSIAVPGEIAGYAVAHKKYGKLSWAALFEPTIKLCESGYQVSKALEKALDSSADILNKDETLRALFASGGDTKNEGDPVKPGKLCETLKAIASKGADEFYKGGVATSIIDDLKKKSGALTLNDLSSYTAEWGNPLKTTLLDDLTLYTANAPGGGAPLALALNLIDEYGNELANPDAALRIHRLSEIWKYSVAAKSKLGDPKFSSLDGLLKAMTSDAYAKDIKSKINDKETYHDASHYGVNADVQDEGTAQVSIIDADGNAVSATSSLNGPFGSGVVSESTGIIMNSALSDFSPESEANKIAPNKRPLSSMAPSIIIDSKDNVKIVIGATGGPKITTAVSSVNKYSC